MQRLEAPLFPVVLAGPSGSGKTTIGRRLLASRGDLLFSVSVTTRATREGERDGVDYRFVERPRFEEMISTGALLEWAEVHGELYGTPRANVEEAAERGAHLLLDIDVQGARQVRGTELDVLTIFLLPPSGKQVLARLGRRGSEDEVELRRRLDTALQELAAVGEFDYVVINDDLDESVGAVDAIITAEERRTTRLGSALVRRAAELGDEIERRLP